jgi:hypothetical protein
MIDKDKAYKYLIYKKTMDRFTDNFEISDIYTELSDGYEYHVVVCEYYQPMDQSHFIVSRKNVYIKDIDIKEWFREMRLKKLNSINDLLD